MKIASVVKNVFAKPALTGAALTVLCGLLLLTPLGDAWVNSSYDCLVRFGARAGANQVVLIQMDDAAGRALHQTRDHWDRALHAQVLDQLAKAGCRLAVFDVLFEDLRNEPTDKMLANAMRRLDVALVAKVEKKDNPGTKIFEVVLPQKLFLDAATNWGIGALNASDATVRRHWPFPAPQNGFPSLPWTAARIVGAQLSDTPQEQWLRYYGAHGGWDTFSYDLALSKLSNAPNYFRGKIVFIGNKPDLSDTNSRSDIFRTPYGEDVGGMEILATTFLNLVKGDWLRRPPAWLEVSLLVFTGILLGGGLCRLKPLPSLLIALGIFLAVMLVFVALSFFSNYWFPWLVVAGGQVPCALAWSWVSRTRQVTFVLERFPGYTPEGEPFGEGAYGRVWLVRNVLGHRQALKEIKRSSFDSADPYEREFRGIQNYKPISQLHLGLLHIDHVNRNDSEGYFYYVMELGDAMIPDWEMKGGSYQAWNLHTLCLNAEGMRLPVRDCIRIGIALTDGLDFLHRQGFVHRDIKPSNVIFVNGCPKLADVGLVRSISPDASQLGTISYMPPEGPGKPPADIFSLGKLLYVISSGKKAESSPELPLSLIEATGFMRLNEIICKACQPAADQRYATAAEMLAALRAAQSELDGGQTEKM